MKRLFAVAVVFASGLVLGFYFRGDSPAALAGGGGGAPSCSSKNGDVNADGKIDLSDAVTILGHLFQGNPTQLLPLCETPPAPSALPDTGQTKCYDQRGNEILCDSVTCAGQDGAYATGCPSEGRFLDNGDGTVTDNCTGLVWQLATAPRLYDWCAAIEYCENSSFAGHDNWRLPNVRELQSIVDYGSASPAIDPVFGAFSWVYWSSTTVAFSPDAAWFVFFNDGCVGIGAKGGDGHVRAVRNAP